MARLTKSMNLPPVIDAFQKWIHDCLIEDGSILSSGALWTPEYVSEVRLAFVEHPDEGKDDFMTKLKGQMLSASPSAQQLMAEMLWTLLVFPSNIRPATKREQVREIWSLSGKELPQNLPLLSDEVLTGIGSGGPGFNNHRSREMVFLIGLTGEMKQIDIAARQRVMSSYETFMDWIENVPQDGHRQFRHMLRYFAFPDRVERMSSNRHRWEVLEVFGVAAKTETKNWSDRQLDEALLKLRNKLQDELPGQILDFYESPLSERWTKSEALPDEKLLSQPPRFWVEKTLVRNRPDRQAGENALGRALWSPQRAEGGRDIYWPMEEVKPGDIIFHFIDNEAVNSFSVAQSAADSSFVGVAGTEWAGRPAYRIRLEQHEEIEPPIERKEFLQEPRYRPIIEQLLKSERGLFFNREFNLNQGSYLTEAPLKLVQIWNDIHIRKTGKPLREAWHIPPLEGTATDASNVATVAFDNTALDKAWAAIHATHLRIERAFLSRFITSLAAKPFVILTGSSGTGKTKLAQLFAHWLTSSSDDTKNGYVVVPVGADWTDNRNVVGFVNHLRKDNSGNPMYQGTAVLDLLLRALEQPNRPFFIILDEMNLSHVERYFADFLSAMESHKPMPLHAESAALNTPQGAIVNRAVLFPDDLFVIGTVNVDETTYMFSPKVLDRANVIEFRVTEDNARAFLKDGSPNIIPIGYAPIGYAEGFMRLCRNAQTSPAPDLALAKESKEPPSPAIESLGKCKWVLEQLLVVLRIARAEFAYRTMAEVMRYVYVDFEFAGDRTSWEWNKCMDAQILQKILPKLHGSKRRIGPLLCALAAFCEQGDVEEASRYAREEKNPETFKATEKDRFASPKFRLSYEKLCEMILAVRRDQFVSFIQ